MYRGTHELVPLFYNTILQNAKERAQSQVYLSYAERRSISMMKFQNAKERAQRQTCLSYAERRSISMMEHQNAKKREQRQTCLSYAERRSISMMKYKNTKTQKCKTYRKLLIKYKIHFASFAKPLHFLCKKVFWCCWPRLLF